jgi:23S rRNA pseudouridine2604 synthase
MEKEYVVTVAGLITEEILQRLRHGLSLDGKALLPAVVEHVQENRLRFILQEGKKRQIRRMCDLVRLKVQSLVRVRIGRITLGSLPIGRWRFLAPGEEF